MTNRKDLLRQQMLEKCEKLRSRALKAENELKTIKGILNIQEPRKAYFYEYTSEDGSSIKLLDRDSNVICLVDAEMLLLITQNLKIK